MYTAPGVQLQPPNADQWRSSGRVRGFVGSLCTWFGLLGVAGFCGYLISDPFAAAGDIRDVLRLLNPLVWVDEVGFLLGVGGLPEARSEGARVNRVMWWQRRPA